MCRDIRGILDTMSIKILYKNIVKAKIKYINLQKYFLHNTFFYKKGSNAPIEDIFLSRQSSKIFIRNFLTEK